MNKRFRAYRIYQFQDRVRGTIEDITVDDLSPGEVLIQSHYSSVNYKDALAGTGKGKILRRFPLIGGIDVSGVVAASKNPSFHEGDPVVATGCGLGETQDGGYSGFVSLPAESVVHLPHGLDLEEAMILGTAGFTAALSLYRLEQNGQTPQKGPIVITGASGGVGTIATSLLAGQGYEVWAVSGKAESAKLLEELGARRVMKVDDLELGTRPLESVRFAGAIDNVGGEVLAGLLRHLDLWGNIASVGLASGVELNTTVMPFILRGASLLGISSNNCAMAVRKEIWKRLAGLWKPSHLRQIHRATIRLEDLPQAFDDILARRVIGRIVVNLQGK